MMMATELARDPRTVGLTTRQKSRASVRGATKFLQLVTYDRLA